MKRLQIAFLLITLSFGPEVMAAISERAFHRIIDQMEDLYRYNSLGETIEFWRYWESSYERDAAIRFPPLTMEKPVIKITGTVAQHSLISEEAFALVLCHELGHHLGGGPQKGTGRLIRWSSAEGQADYWAARHCLPHYFSHDPHHQQKLSQLPLPDRLRHQCQNSFFNDQEQGLCMRTLYSAFVIGNYFAATNHTEVDDRLKAPAVNKLIREFRWDRYRDQCRLETFLAGALHWPRPDCWFPSSE